MRLRMDDHKKAYLFWKEMGFFHSSCLHVDAHLDISNFKTPSTDCDENPELNCANFLLFAIQQEIVSEVVWIVPPYLVGEFDMLDWFREEIRRWMRIDQDDYFSFSKLGPRTVLGQLAGARLLVTTLEELHQHWQPPVDRPLLLDIDIDYFLGQELGLASDRCVVWQTPWELLEKLGPLTYTAETVADSVSGGYTPLELRCLGFLTELCLDDQTELAKQNWETINDPSAEIGLTSDWVGAARLGQRLVRSKIPRNDARWSELVEFHPEFAFQQFDQTALYFQRKMDQELLHFLTTAKPEPDSDAESLYMSAFLAARQGDLQLAIQNLESLALENTKDLVDVAPDTRTASHLLGLCGRFALEASQYSAANSFFQRAIQLDSKDEEFWRGLAECWAAVGDLAQATKCLRKVVALAPKLLEAGETRLRLIQLYRESGQRLLFQAESDRLKLAHPHLQHRLN
jgi:hypothetical protein